MLVALIGKNKINKIYLPNSLVGNYWITDKTSEKEKKLVNIEGNGFEWQVKSSKSFKLIKKENIKFTKNKLTYNQQGDENVEQVVLKEYETYYVYIKSFDEVFVLYCLPTYDTSFRKLKVKQYGEITIGNNLHNSIFYENDLIEPVHAKIYYDKGRWILENFDMRIGTFVNDAPVYKTIRVLLNGDIINIVGLKIIIMGNFLFINDPLNKVKYSEKCFELVDETLSDIKDFKENNEDELDNTEDEEKKYFSRSPRIVNKIECETVKIDQPPAIQNKDEMPGFLVLGSTISMGIVMVLSMTTGFNGLSSGKGLNIETVFQLLMSFVMLISMVLFPILERRYEKKQKAKYEEKRQKRYKEYIESKIKRIDEIMYTQRKILFENYISAEECSNIILTNSPRLWERKIEDADFLSLRLGVGDVPLQIDIQYPEKQFAMEDDNLIETLNTVANKSKILKKVPVVFSLKEKNITGIISKDEEEEKRFIKNLILQLITFQSYEDLKLVFLLKDNNRKKWEHLKMLPHTWSNIKDIRFFASDYEEMKEISRYLEEELASRTELQEQSEYSDYSPYYIIITDDYKKIENLKIIKQVLQCKYNYGFSLLCMSDNLTQLPNECKTFIELKNGNGKIFESEVTSKNQRKFLYNNSERLFFEKITKSLSNIPIRFTASKDMSLPNSYTFLQMYNVGRIEQLNILDRWNKNDTTLSLKAPIGIDNFGMPIVLDIHEKFHGPHGLIAGSTGSGKSEFIITYILSLAINYHPDDVNFILIDYKGGGLAGAFQKREVKLPHLVGTITNIDTVGLQRSLDSIQSELRRRQIIFNEARNMTDEGTIDIYKYQKLYHEGVVDKPVPHLLIICDEFAELKQQQPDFMDELISVARIGRSLGVHLILATQKPAGVVNDQITSNSKFAICLKVQSTEDSNDVINKPDAAFLKTAGRFYLKVGNDEYYVLGQSGWSGAPYFPADVIKTKVDNSIEFISDIGITIKKVDDTVQKSLKNEGEQLTNIVKYIYELGKQEKIQTQPLWLENIPEKIFVDEVRKKYNIKNEKNIISPVIGEYDNPANQSQGVYRLKLSEEGNALIFGSADSGKETLLSTIVYDIATNYTTEEAQLYLLDFGSEALKIFQKCPHVGDVVFMSDTEKINRFFDMIQAEIKNRKQILSDYNGNYNLYLETSGKPMPMIVIVINGYEAFSENFEDEYDDILLSITREGIKCGITFILTVGTYNDIRYRLAQNFKQKIVLQLNNDDDYSNILEDVGKKRPSKFFGRGLITIDGGVYEFQTAKICEQAEWNNYIKQTIEELIEKNHICAKKIPVIPSKVTIEDVREDLKDMSKVPLGISKNSLKIINYDFTSQLVNIIVAKNMENATQYVASLIEEIKELDDVEITILDAERVIRVGKNDLSEDYEDFVSRLDDEDNDKYQVVVIIGIDKFINDLEDDENEFLEKLKQAEETNNYTFIIVENETRLKNREYDDWYKDYIPEDSGIWIGNGIQDQYIMNISNSEKEAPSNCGISFGYLVKQGKATMIKLVGMKEKGEDDG